MAVSGETWKVAELEEVLAGEKEEVVTGEIDEVVTGDMDELGTGLEEAGLDDRLEVGTDYCIWIAKKVAAMRKEQIQSMEGGWMRCANCRKRGSLRCAACFMTTYCGLECHEKDWGEGHRGRCRQIRKEFVEVVLEPTDKDKTEGPLLYFTVVVSVCSLQSDLYIYNKDDSEAGLMVRQVRRRRTMSSGRWWRSRAWCWSWTRLG